MSLDEYAPMALRIGISLVFLWFSLSQLTGPEDWTGVLPAFLRQSPNPEAYIYINGSLELVFGLALLLGLFVRPVAILLVLHLLGIIITLEYNSISVRDFGLMMATITIFLHGPDCWCLRRSKK